VKQEPPYAPPRRSSGALVFREGGRTSSSPRNRKRKPRKNDAKAASKLADAEAARAEEAAMREAIAKSLADLVPADNAMSMDAALAWSRQDWEREQAEQQRQLLDLAQARRRAEAAALLARGAPIVKLQDSSDDDLYKPTPPRFGDAGQGPAVGPPARVASRRRGTTPATPATTTAATTHVSIAISACRTRVFSLG
jgi:hypothetical protein